MKPRTIIKRIENKFKADTHINHPDFVDELEQAFIRFGKKERKLERKECAELAETVPESQFDLDHEPAPTEQQVRKGIAHLIRKRK